MHFGHISKRDFHSNQELIERLMTFHHEHTHLYQTMGTLNGYILFECLATSVTSIFPTCGRVKYKLPLLGFLSSGQPGEDLSTHSFKDYWKFIRGFYSKFLIDWNQGDHKLFPLPEELDPKIHLLLIERTIPFTNETFDKALGIAPKSLPQIVLSTNQQAYTMFLGSFSLLEAFAKSVEFEHLLWFNQKEGEICIDRFMNDARNLIYTVPLALFDNEITSNHLESLNFQLAIFRVICDIALMYQDVMLNDENLSANRLTDKPYFATQTQPADTFLRALGALKHIPPLQDHGKDLLRFYDNVCEEIGIPTQNEMVERGIKAISNRMNLFNDEVFFKIQENYLRIMLLRKQYPLFFINDLIYIDKSQEMSKHFRDLVYYVDSRRRGILTTDKNELEAPMVGLLADILVQLFTSKTVSCNFERLYGRCSRKGTGCLTTFPADIPVVPKSVPISNSSNRFIKMPFLQIDRYALLP